jgi:hypothetical protein
MLAAADGLLERGVWIRRMHGMFRDVVVLVQDTGMRNKKELFRARIALTGQETETTAAFSENRRTLGSWT